MTAWPEPVERVAEVLRAAAVDSRVEEFAGGTPTARAAAEAAGCELGQIVKSLVLVCDGAYVLALVPGDRRADEAAIAGTLEAEHVRVAIPDEVVHATGFEPGGVAPFPQRAITRTLMDRGLLGQPSSGSAPAARRTWPRSRRSICSVFPARASSTSSPRARLRVSREKEQRCRRPRRSG